MFWFYDTNFCYNTSYNIFSRIEFFFFFLWPSRLICLLNFKVPMASGPGEPWRPRGLGHANATLPRLLKLESALSKPRGLQGSPDPDAIASSRYWTSSPLKYLKKFNIWRRVWALKIKNSLCCIEVISGWILQKTRFPKL